MEYLPIIFLFIALFYSAIGFGGGSSYLALLSVFLVDFNEIRSTALLLNLFVVSIGTFNYIKNKVFSLRLFLPFLLAGMAFTFIGAQLQLRETLFFITLGILLILSGVFMVLRYLKIKNNASSNINLGKKLFIGGSVGLFAGISGIGGGIFLSPTLNLSGWGNPRLIAALASSFILVNSISGLLSLKLAGSFIINYSFIFKLIIAVSLGAFAGTYLSHKKLNLSAISLITALLVIYVGVKTILQHGFGVGI